jgi:serine protease Do
MFKYAKSLTILSLFAFSVFTLNGCKYGAVEEVPNAPNQTQNQPPAPPPMMADGTRASYADVVERAAPAVLKVNSERKGNASTRQNPLLDNPMFREFFRDNPQSPQPQQPRAPVERGVGSGVIVSADGTILTNNHVIEGADKITVELNDNRTFDAKVVGTDPLSDLAVLKIESSGLPYLNLGDSDRVRVGDIVLAIGNPLGIGQTVTSGIISAKGRRTGISDGSFEDFLQTDAPINRGNSGGALINLNGELIGINSQILSPSGGNIGIGFSIPSNMAKSVMEQLVKDGKVRRGQLGVGIQRIDEGMKEQFGLKDTKGVFINQIRPGSAAEKAGLKRDDVIIAVNGERVEDTNILRNRIAGTLPGTEVTLTILRDGKEQQVKVTLDELQPENRSANPNQPGGENPPNDSPGGGGKLGLDLQPLTPELARRLQIPADAKGMVVTNVDQTSPAAEEGIQRGDVIQSINRQPVETFDEVAAALEKSGDRPILLLVSRGGQTFYITVQPAR